MSQRLSNLCKLLWRWDAWALALVIAMGGLVCVEFFATMQQSQQLAEPDINDNSWQTYQLHLELNRLDRTLHDFMDGAADADAVQMRLDILTSRLLPVDQQGSIQSAPTALQALQVLTRAIDSWSHKIPLLASKRPQALAIATQLRREISQQEHAVQALILTVHEVQTLRVDEERRHLHRRFFRLTTIFGLLGLGVTLFVGILMVRSSREKRLTQTLAHLNEHLEAKVAERTQALGEQTEMLNMILEASPVGVALINESTHQLVFANSQLTKCFDLPATQREGMPLQSLFANPVHEQAFWRQLDEQGTVDNHEAELRTTQGERVGVLTAKRFTFSQTPQKLIWIYDISERKQLENRLRKLATYDSLTGAVTRAAFLDALTHGIQRARLSDGALSLLTLDVDYFKRINDTHGHPVGDLALQQLSRLVQSTLRKHDVFGRLGGEEFCMMLADTPPSNAKAIAERIRSLIESTRIALEGGAHLSFTVSIGIAAFQQGDSSDTLLMRADSALYQAKRGGRNRLAVAA